MNEGLNGLEMHPLCVKKLLNRRAHLEHLDLGRMVIIIMNHKRKGIGWCEFTWRRVGVSRGLSWTQEWTCRFLIEGACIDEVSNRPLLRKACSADLRKYVQFLCCGREELKALHLLLAILTCQLMSQVFCAPVGWADARWFFGGCRTTERTVYVSFSWKCHLGAAGDRHFIKGECANWGWAVLQLLRTQITCVHISFVCILISCFCSSVC